MSLLLGNRSLIRKAPYLAKVTHWLDAAVALESLIIKSGSKVLSWQDKVNSNVWLDFNAGFNVTHTASSGHVDFYAGGLYFTNALLNAKEVVIIAKRTTIQFNNYALGAVENGNSFVYDNVNGSVQPLIFTTGTVGGLIYKNINTLNNKMVFDGSWTTSLYNSALIGVRQTLVFPFEAEIYDFILFDSVLTTNERTTLWADLKIKHPDITNL